MKAHAKHVVTALTLIALITPSTARATGGTYDIDGGTRAERAQIPRALNASSFDWSVVPARIHFHIARGVASSATPGQIWLDADLLDAGSFAWGVIQHEYGHQVDFFRLTDANRTELLPLLGGDAWWDPPGVTLPHHQLAGERFASTLAWSYWPSPENSMRPQGPGDESAAMPPARFRALIQRILNLSPLPSPAPAVVQHAPPTKTRPPTRNDGGHKRRRSDRVDSPPRARTDAARRRGSAQLARRRARRTRRR